VAKAADRNTKRREREREDPFQLRSRLHRWVRPHQPPSYDVNSSSCKDSTSLGRASCCSTTWSAASPERVLVAPIQEHWTGGECCVSDAATRLGKLVLVPTQGALEPGGQVCVEGIRALCAAVNRRRPPTRKSTGPVGECMRPIASLSHDRQLFGTVPMRMEHWRRLVLLEGVAACACGNSSSCTDSKEHWTGASSVSRFRIASRATRVVVHRYEGHWTAVLFLRRALQLRRGIPRRAPESNQHWTRRLCCS